MENNKGKNKITNNNNNHHHHHHHNNNNNNNNQVDDGSDKPYSCKYCSTRHTMKEWVGGTHHIHKKKNPDTGYPCPRHPDYNHTVILHAVNFLSKKLLNDGVEKGENRHPDENPYYYHSDNFNKFSIDFILILCNIAKSTSDIELKNVVLVKLEFLCNKWKKAFKTLKDLSMYSSCNNPNINRENSSSSSSSSKSNPLKKKNEIQIEPNDLLNGMQGIILLETMGIQHSELKNEIKQYIRYHLVTSKKLKINDFFGYRPDLYLPEYVEEVTSKGQISRYRAFGTALRNIVIKQQFGNINANHPDSDSKIYRKFDSITPIDMMEVLPSLKPYKTKSEFCNDCFVVNGEEDKDKDKDIKYIKDHYNENLHNKLNDWIEQIQMVIILIQTLSNDGLLRLRKTQFFDEAEILKKSMVDAININDIHLVGGITQCLKILGYTIKNDKNKILEKGINYILQNQIQIPSTATGIDQQCHWNNNFIRRNNMNANDLYVTMSGSIAAINGLRDVNFNHGFGPYDLSLDMSLAKFILEDSQGLHTYALSHAKFYKSSKCKEIESIQDHYRKGVDAYIQDKKRSRMDMCNLSLAKKGELHSLTLKKHKKQIMKEKKSGGTISICNNDNNVIGLKDFVYDDEGEYYMNQHKDNVEILIQKHSKQLTEESIFRKDYDEYCKRNQVDTDDLLDDSLDLYRLYHAVVQYGGYTNVTTRRLWNDIADNTSSESDNINRGTFLKSCYKKYLKDFEIEWADVVDEREFLAAYNS